MVDVVDRVVALAGALREEGVVVGAGESALALRALQAVDPGDREASRLALRPVLCARHEDLAAFDRAFGEVFGAFVPLTFDDPDAEDPVEVSREIASNTQDDPSAQPDDPDGEDATPPAAASAIEVLRRKDFAAYTEDELLQARALLADLARRGPTRMGRRHRPVRGSRGRADLRGTMRSAVRHDGEVLELRRRAPVPVPRRLVLVLDVSGSMAAYARILLQYAQAAVAARARVEVFAFGTRLTRLTLELRGRDPDAALERAAHAVTDWSGGTRIGASLAELNRTHGRHVGRGADVVILSDGWDRGEPELLAQEMARLRRTAHRVVWLNPLRAAPDYEPLVRGMAAALPHTDHFMAGHSLASLDELAALLEGGLR
jgi:uncharacterized protein with von Willebrand factor type A (vWA) domain